MMFSLPLGLTEAEREVVTRLFAKLASVQAINEKRRRYYEAAQEVKHLGIAVPPHLQAVQTVLEWPEKAIQHLDGRINLDGFFAPDEDGVPFGIDRIMRQNRLAIQAPITHTEAMKYGPAFLLVSGGRTRFEPEIVVRTLSARHTTAEWSATENRVTALLSTAQPPAGFVSEFVFADDENTVTCIRAASGEWTIDRQPNRIGRCPATVLRYRPDLDNPFGRSRISQGVMSVTDRAIRTLLRMEITAEFFSAPQRYLMGAEESLFVDDEGNKVSTWEALIGRVNSIPRDEDGQVPELVQAPQTSMTPHIEQVRSEAAIFSGMTDIPVGALGIVHDNPSSDAAMHTAYLALDKVAERATATFGAGWVEAMQMAVCMRDGTDTVSAELEALESKWRPVSTPTRAAAADAMSKEITAIPWIADSEVALEGFGHDQATIARLMAAKDRAAAGDRLGELLTPTEGQAATIDPDDLKKRFDALGIAIRAGVDPVEAAAKVGLGGIGFTGATPVALRLPTDDARKLEDR